MSIDDKRRDDLPPQGGARPLELGERPENVTPIRRRVEIDKSESPENEENALATPAQLRQQITDLKKQLEYVSRMSQERKSSARYWETQYLLMKDVVTKATDNMVASNERLTQLEEQLRDVRRENTRLKAKTGTSGTFRR